MKLYVTIRKELFFSRVFKVVCAAVVAMFCAVNVTMAQGNALSFDGVDDHVLVPSAASIQISTGTIEAWIKTSSSGGFRGIVALNPSYVLVIDNNNKVAAYPASGSEIVATTSVNDGEWHHVAFTFEDNVTNGAKIYIDGNLEVTATYDVNTSSYPWDLTIGSNAPTQQYLNGQIDEVRIWNTVRTQGEIQANMMKSLSGRESGLVAYYIMNASSGTTLLDQTTNGNDGALTDGPTWVASGVPFKPYKGQALDFDGSSEYVVTDEAISNVYNNITAELWIKPDVNMGNGKWDRLVGTGINTNWLFTGKHLNTNALNVAMGANYEVATSPNNTVKVGVWQHVAFTFNDATDEVTIYHNGDVVDTGTYSGSFSGGGLLGIGRDGPSGTEHFNGQIDEVRVWSVVRTQTELRDNMNTRLTGTESGLEAYYAFDATSGTKVMDLSLKGNHATTQSMGDENWVASDFAYKGYTANVTGFRMLAAPTSVSYATLLSNVWTQGATGGDVTNGSANVWTWNNSGSGDVSSNWTAVANLSTSLTSGQGFLYYHFNNDDFAGNNNYYSTDISVAGTEFSDPTITINSTIDGWTLVGNPYFTSINWTTISAGSSNLYADARVWDPVSSSWKLTSSEPMIAPYQSFFVRTQAGSPTLSIDSGDKVYGGTFRAKEVEQIELAITARSGNFRDEAMLRFHADAQLGNDYLDAVKTTPLSTSYLAIPLADGEKTFAIRSLPLITEAVEIPMAVDFTQSGKVTLGVRVNSMPDGWSAELSDTKTGSKITLDGATESVYSFDHVFAGKLRNAKDIVAAPIEMKAAGESRFVLKITPANATSNEIGNLPSKLALEQNYPNPFNPSTTIRFALPQSGNVKLEVLNMLGQTVATVANGAFSAGNHTVSFDASKLSSGVYVYRIQTGGSIITRKMSLIK